MTHARARISCELGDITKLATDAIVNAANTALRGGGGVDGAIHRAAGPELLKELVERYPEGCRTGDACITHGHRLPAKWIVHTAGPVWHGGDRGEPELLAACHRNALRVAAEHGCRTLAFPAISTGIYGYPVDQAAAVAIPALAEELEHLPEIDSVTFVLFSRDVLTAFENELARH